MKISKLLFALTLSALFITSCTKEDSNEPENNTSTTNQDDGENPVTTGDFVLKFDNGVGDQDFIVGTVYSKSNNETFKLQTLKYIVSNIKLKDVEGNVFEYPAEKNIFIVDEANGNEAGEIKITLEGVNIGDYTEISFGLGVDQKRYKLGANGQGDFLVEAKKAGMMWAWQTGYRFIRLDGMYSVTGDADATDLPLNVHMGSVGTALDNYKEVTLQLPNTAKVANGKTPEVHIMSNIAKIFDGEKQLKLHDYTDVEDDGYAQVHTSETKSPVIANHLKSIFMVHHVHNSN